MKEIFQTHNISIFVCLLAITVPKQIIITEIIDSIQNAHDDKKDDEIRANRM